MSNLSEEETEKKLQNLIHKSEIMMSTTVEHIGTGIICKMSDEDKKTLVDLIAMCLDFRSLYTKEKEKNKELLSVLNKSGLDTIALVNDVNNNYISKDKIREKMLEIERRLRAEYDLYEKAEEKSDAQHAIHRRINMLNFIEDELKELLEEVE